MDYNNDWVLTEDLASIFKRLVSSQETDSSYPSAPLLANVAKRLISCEVKPGGPYTSKDGSICVDTNLLIASFFKARNVYLPGLEKYLKQQMLLNNVRAGNPTYTTTAQLPADSHIAKLQAQVFDSMSTDSTQGSWPIQNMLEGLVSTIRIADADKEIALISYFFGASLLPEYQQGFENYYHNLGKANIYCWMSYTVYDDFLDDEGTARLLPAANIAARQSVAGYIHVAGELKCSQDTVIEFFDRMDRANDWELQHCRFQASKDSIMIGQLPNYGNYSVLSERALGHAAGPLILSKSLVALNHAAHEHATKAIEQYLIAKQLCDDLHDWKKDLQKGHISPVVALLLSGAGIVVGRTSFIELLPRLVDYFWDLGFMIISKEIQKHTSAAKILMKKSAAFKNNSKFENMITVIEFSVNNNINIYERQQQFLKSYSS